MSQTYRHPDGEDAPFKVGEYPGWTANPDDEGYFEAPIDPEHAEELGFEVVGDDDVTDQMQVNLEDLDHGELKELAEDEGLAEEIDLRSKDSIIGGLRDAGVVG